ncbi:LEAF RUST 10 DISEASE-RESISTANCE LOCUS RECEPTOR-LIKE PROTEIN KINASE-like 1.4 [Bidens hawaiensis]|uniref:LEAF RUST 10 DISEASE-RESISTANCE LOCUS RECEPTOR-LIKE PROTEIN KINASE-like 1.4 n=1 Tax=Bidens hawaiensis TaxID=980011 RepID=UPI00404B657C
MPPQSIFSVTVTVTVILIRFCALTVSLSEPDFSPFPNCEGTFSCGNIDNLTYPFTGGNRPDHCGPPEFRLTCPDNTYPEIIIQSVNYRVLEVNLTEKTLVLARSDLWNNTCPGTFVNSTLDSTIFDAGGGKNVDLTIFFGCSSSPMVIQPQNRFYCDVGGVDLTDSYFLIGEVPIDPILKMIHCTNGVTIPLLRTVGADLNRSLLTLAQALTCGFEVVYSDPYGDQCSMCSKLDGECGFDSTTAQSVCICNSRICSPPGSSKKGSVILTIILPTIGAVLVGAAILWGLFVCKQRRNIRATKEPSTTKTECKSILTTDSSSRFYSYPQSIYSSSVPSYPSLKTTKEFAKCSYFGAQVFTLEELEVATDNFSDSREIGDGGCGTVYHGKLLDGREVAVKRLYENNYKRVEQFMNEVAILTRLDHENLVKLYGCTSKRSRELLLVYEYIPNGTVADHLHGKLARSNSKSKSTTKSNSGLFTWSVRLNIAIETAKALAYLHESDIIHRDVKTHNILLDKSFKVKVADFGLSRLFPNNATHVSTAPQGTPGYVDPEYYQCYQLTDKSDVYSFGVVLIELISSLQAVDTNRDRLEINLAAMAINKIQSHTLDELVDKSLGFETNGFVRRMVTLVAELAFRCLQQESGMRPTMKEVVEALRGIQSEELNAQKPEVLDIVVDDGALFNNQNTEPPSPDYGVTNKLYGSCMPNSSDA